jgi:hypothetical protein
MTAGHIVTLLMVIGVAACDNVEWGGVDMTVVPPPPQSGPAAGPMEAGDRLPGGPILYHVTRDSAGTTMIPVGEIADGALHPIPTGDDAAEFSDRFITAFLRQGAEFTLFHQGRRAGSLTVQSATAPAPGACRALPRATGSLQLAEAGTEATEFLAMPRTQAPEGRMIPGGEIAVEGRMQVVGNILAERALRARRAPLPNWARARRQIHPFPVSETRDLGFTATFLVDDELAIGNDDEGYSLFIVYTPMAQSGYDTAYVKYTSYTAEGKAAPRTIDFLDWDRDGSPELLLEVFGTRNKWYAAVGSDDDEWSRIFEDLCDPGAEVAPADTAAADTTASDTTASGTTGARTGTAGTRPAGRSGTSGTPQPAAAPLQANPMDPFAAIRPRIELSNPSAPRPARRDTAPDTSGIRQPRH